ISRLYRHELLLLLGHLRGRWCWRFLLLATKRWQIEIEPVSIEELVSSPHTHAEHSDNQQHDDALKRAIEACTFVPWYWLRLIMQRRCRRGLRRRQVHHRCGLGRTAATTGTQCLTKRLLHSASTAKPAGRVLREALTDHGING